MGRTLWWQLHQRKADEHPHLGDPCDLSRGNGIVLWLATDDFDAVPRRVETSGAVVLDGALLKSELPTS